MRNARISLALVFVLLACIVFQWYSRYSGAPFTDLCVDDWGLLVRAQTYDSYAASWRALLQWPDRPLGSGFLVSTYHAVGDNAPLYALISMLFTALFLGFGLALAYELTESVHATLLFGLFFSLTPNLTESFHWYIMTLYGLGFTAYLVSAWSWVRMTKTGQWRHAAAAAFFYALGLAHYETGILLPFAFLLLTTRRNISRVVLGWVVLMLIAAVFLAWRSTNGFGLCHDILFPQRRLELSLPDVMWNAKEAIRWWVGGRMLNCLVEGLGRFLLESNLVQFGLGVCNLLATIAATALIVRNYRREETAGTPPAQPTFSTTQCLVFAVGWAVVTQFLSVVSWNSGRQNYFPAIGVSLLLAVLLARLQPQRWVAAFAVVCMLCLTANQGTSLSWRDSGEFQRRIYDYLEAHVADWTKSEQILFDTRSLRERQTRGILAPTSDDVSTFVYTGNACLLHGFALNAMLLLSNPGAPSPKGIMDMEYGAKIEGSDLSWHEWYDPGKPFRTPLSKVYIVDCLAVGSGQEK